MPQDGERTENLGGGIRAIVSREHTFGADAVLLAHFSAPRQGERLCDLGTGCGVIPLLWCRDGGVFQIDAFEIQPGAVRLARDAAVSNALAITVYERDLRQIESSFYQRYDLVTCNPPFFKAGAAKVSNGSSSAVARHETQCTLEEVITAAAKLLKHGGRFCLCQRPERLTDVLTQMRGAGVEPKRLRMVQQNKTAKPWLVLVEGRRGGRPGLDVPPALLVEEDGAVSEEMRIIYGNYQE